MDASSEAASPTHAVSAASVAGTSEDAFPSPGSSTLGSSTGGTGGAPASEGDEVAAGPFRDKVSANDVVDLAPLVAAAGCFSGVWDATADVALEAGFMSVHRQRAASGCLVSAGSLP